MGSSVPAAILYRYLKLVLAILSYAGECSPQAKVTTGQLRKVEIAAD